MIYLKKRGVPLSYRVPLTVCEFQAVWLTERFWRQARTRWTGDEASLEAWRLTTLVCFRAMSRGRDFGMAVGQASQVKAGQSFGNSETCGVTGTHRNLLLAIGVPPVRQGFG